MKVLRNLGGMVSVALLLGLLMFSAPAGAQSLTALSLERTLTLNNILTTVTPTIPANVAAAIAGGAVEIREQVVFNSQSNTLTSTAFLVPAGAPTPTNLATLPFSSFIAVSTTAISRSVVSSKPILAVTIVGLVIQSMSPYGSAVGSPSTFSFGLSTDTPPKISNVIETEAGLIVLYSASAQGTVTITQPTTGGGGGTAGITVVVNGATVGASGATFQTLGNLVTLDASASKSTNAGTLTFTWSTAAGSPSAAIIGTGTPGVVQVQLGAGKGTYVIQLTVTDSKGVSSTVNITIQYV